VGTGQTSTCTGGGASAHTAGVAALDGTEELLGDPFDTGPGGVHGTPEGLAHRMDIDDRQEGGGDDDQGKEGYQSEGELGPETARVVGVALLPTVPIGPEVADGHQPEGTEQVGNQVKDGHAALEEGDDGGDDATGQQAEQGGAPPVDLPGGKEGKGPDQEGGEELEDDAVLGLPSPRGYLHPPPDTDAQSVDLLPDEEGWGGEWKGPAEHGPPPALEPAGGVANLVRQDGQGRQEPPDDEYGQADAKQPTEKDHIPGGETGAY
jgi:hypothetical protein